MRRLFWLEVLRALRRFPAMPRHWMVKSEPASYSWEQFTKDGHAAWTGVRNFQARNNLRAMKTGDVVLFYHSVTGKEVVGIAKVAREAYPDPTADEPGWDCVDIVPAKPLKKSVTLAAIKAAPALKDIGLLKQSRLSVMPLTAEEYAVILKLSA
jgi:predicted RNA-binding protein with PUA-like domain